MPLAMRANIGGRRRVRVASRNRAYDIFPIGRGNFPSGWPGDER